MLSFIINHLSCVDVQMMKNKSYLIHGKRVFFSDAKDDNPLDSIVQKVNIVQLPSDVWIINIVIPLNFMLIFFVTLSLLHYFAKIIVVTCILLISVANIFSCISLTQHRRKSWYHLLICTVTWDIQSSYLHLTE